MVILCTRIYFHSGWLGEHSDDCAGLRHIGTQEQEKPSGRERKFITKSWTPDAAADAAANALSNVSIVACGVSR